MADTGTTIPPVPRARSGTTERTSPTTSGSSEAAGTGRESPPGESATVLDQHDALIQRLYVTGLHLQSAARCVHQQPDEALASIEQAVEELSDVIRDLRSTAYDERVEGESRRSKTRS